jgi:hypothetical protein
MFMIHDKCGWALEWFMRVLSWLTKHV